jgi:hypothetical protein
MQDDEGRILIEHFYDGIVPLSDGERRAIAAAPDADATLMRELWLGRTEGGGKKLVEMINLPSFNARGIGAGKVGEQATNIVLEKATASLDLRLVKGMDDAQTAQRVIEHFRTQGYYVIESETDAPDVAPESGTRHHRQRRVQRVPYPENCLRQPSLLAEPWSNCPRSAAVYRST